MGARFSPFRTIVEKIWGVDITNHADARLLKKIGAFFSRDFSKITIRTGGILPAIVPLRYTAIAIGKTINVAHGMKGVLSDPSVMAEELYHVIQWEKQGWGFFPLRYLYYHCARGYDKNPIEMEAKQKALLFCENLRSGMGEAPDL